VALPEGFLDELKDRLDVPAVIGKRVKLIRRGRQFLGLCPFHGEKTPSFHVWHDHFHCFGCGAHGSLIDFVMQADGVGFREAVERLASLAGLSVPEPPPEVRERERRRGSLLQVLDAAALHFARMLRLPEGKPALDYLLRRGVGDDAIARFRLGFAADGSRSLKAALAREGFTDAAMVEAGLLVQPEDAGRSPYDRFRGRVMFPIADQRRRVRGFGGRILGPGEPKYLNSPETPLFHKGSLLYGIDHAAPAVREAGTVIVVEGYMDVIGMAVAGWNNVVAPLGTALTEDQLQALWALAAEPVLLFDPDAAGERAALRAAERALPLLKPGLGLKIALLQVDTRDDPDRVASRYPPQVMHRTLQEAAALSDFLFRVENKGRLHVPAEERAALEDRLRRHAETIADPGVRGHFIRAFRERAWQSVRAGSNRASGSGRGAFGGRASAPKGASFRGTAAPTGFAAGGAPAGMMSSAVTPTDGRTRAEATLIAIAAHHPALFADFEEDFGRLAFVDRDLDGLRQDLLALLSAGTDLESDPASLLSRPGAAATLMRILDDPAVARSPSIGRDADPASVRASWAMHVALLRRDALKAELASHSADDVTSTEGWERRRALIQAAMQPADDDG